MSLSSGHSSVEMSNGRPLCARCRVPMWTIRAQPERTGDYEQKFQCPRCEHSLINVRQARTSGVNPRDTGVSSATSHEAQRRKQLVKS